MTKLAFAAVAAALVLSGCGGATPIDTATATNGFKASFIGTVDGCRVWRIEDIHYVYFARCPEGAVPTQTDYRCGKGCVRPLQMIVGRAP